MNFGIVTRILKKRNYKRDVNMDITALIQTEKEAIEFCKEFRLEIKFEYDVIKVSDHHVLVYCNDFVQGVKDLQQSLLKMIDRREIQPILKTSVYLQNKEQHMEQDKQIKKQLKKAGLIP